jgi:hypothetical protein
MRRTLIEAVGGEILGGALSAGQQLITVQFQNVKPVDDDLAEVAGKVRVASGACLTCNILYHLGNSDHTAKTKYRNFQTNIPPEKEYRGLSPNFHIHASVSDLYIPTIGLPILLEEICRPILGRYKSLTDT